MEGTEEQEQLTEAQAQDRVMDLSLDIVLAVLGVAVLQACSRDLFDHAGGNQAR